jgi:N-acyl-D-amino-acid deacylase
MPADWLSVSDFLDKFNRSVSINVAMILGNSPPRIWGVGWNDRPATPEELENMKSVVREAMEDGAVGLSTGLDYPPGSYASTEELSALGEVTARLGGFYHTHTRASLLKRSQLAPWEEALQIGRDGNIPVHLTHYRQSAQGAGSHWDYINLVEDARNNGMDVTFDCYPYPYSGTRITIALPQWTMDGGPERLKEAFSSSEDRDAMKRDMTDKSGGWRQLDDQWLTNFTLPHNKGYEGHSITEIADMRGQDPYDTLFDLLDEEGLGLSTVSLGTNAQTLPAFVSHPYGMVGSDAILFGDYPNPRTYGTYPVILAEFVRADKQLRLPEAIRKMTSFPAQRLGIPNRGILRDGFKADIVLFNKHTVKTRATKANPKVFPEGIPYVIVNGKVVIDDEVHTGEFPGRGIGRNRW